MNKNTKRFMALFDGYEKAHGQYRVTSKGDDGKLSGRAITNSEPASEQNYTEHLEGGAYILGVIMLKQNNTCSFGCIDIDPKNYSKFKIENYLALFQQYKLPLIPLLSKSGGLHCYLFLKEP